MQLRWLFLIALWTILSGPIFAPVAAPGSHRRFRQAPPAASPPVKAAPAVPR
jgi:hypothetical protein